jgi:hypothetical protein
VPPAAAQAAAVPTVQVPSNLQHPPVGGCGQVIEPQSTPSPRYVPPWLVQPVAEDVTQAPLGRQQAPVTPSGS